MNDHSNFNIGSTFRICSPITQISITQPSYELIHHNIQAKCKYDIYHLWISNNCKSPILNSHSLWTGNLIPVTKQITIYSCSNGSFLMR